jgi:hypothetical protein
LKMMPPFLEQPDELKGIESFFDEIEMFAWYVCTVETIDNAHHTTWSNKVFTNGCHGVKQSWNFECTILSITCNVFCINRFGKVQIVRLFHWQVQVHAHTQRLKSLGNANQKNNLLGACRPTYWKCKFLWEARLDLRTRWRIWLISY